MGNLKKKIIGVSFPKCALLLHTYSKSYYTMLSSIRGSFIPFPLPHLSIFPHLFFHRILTCVCALFCICEEDGLPESLPAEQPRERRIYIAGTYNVTTYMYSNVYTPMLLMYKYMHSVSLGNRTCRHDRFATCEKLPFPARYMPQWNTVT